nr:hypothetical protein [Bacteroidota bacterium]
MVYPRAVVIKFLRLTRLNKIVSRIYYKYFHGFNSIVKELPGVIEKCIDKAVELKTADIGDYCEFGIFKGFAFAYACNYARRLNLQKMRFFGFDSFKGLPDIEGLDITKDMPFYKGQYLAGKEQVMKDINKTNVDWSRTHLIEGFFNISLTYETKKKHEMNKIALCLIDCDLHSSTVSVLNFIQDMIIDNTILIFDDWNAFNKDNERGQRRA